MGQSGWIGRSLNGRYHVEALLGQGGMSAVYRGSDPNLRRTVAIKLIHGHLSEDPKFVSRIRRRGSLSRPPQAPKHHPGSRFRP